MDQGSTAAPQRSALLRAPAEPEPGLAIAFVLALGRALHRYGTPAYRLEEGLRRVCDRLDIEAEVFTTPTAIIMSFGPATDLRTRMMRVDGGELDMGKLAQLDALADDVVAHRMSAADGVKRVDAIVAAPPRFGRALSTAAAALTAASIAVFFGGSLADVAVAGGIGLLLGMLAQFVSRSTEQARVLELVSAAFAALAASLAAAVWPGITPSLVTVCALVILLPGLSLTVAIAELATRNLIAGTARLMQAVIVLLELVVGVALGEKLASVLVTVPHVTPVALPEWARWVALAVASTSLAIVVQAGVRQLGWIVAACAVGYVGSRTGAAWLGGPLGMTGVLVGALGLGVMSNIYARWLDRPAQVVQVPAVLLLVPGSMGFRGMASLLDKDTLSGVETLFAMFVVALAIVAGLLVSSAIVSPRRSL
ncbi:MAG TPA: threonine/serine exporter family protein [Kofleriaceae bacterium]|nr:threonine/serine exporter family protein [Kofleriaceae bacterium]